MTYSNAALADKVESAEDEEGGGIVAARRWARPDAEVRIESIVLLKQICNILLLLFDQARGELKAKVDANKGAVSCALFSRS